MTTPCEHVVGPPPLPIRHEPGSGGEDGRDGSRVFVDARFVEGGAHRVQFFATRLKFSRRAEVTLVDEQRAEAFQSLSAWVTGHFPAMKALGVTKPNAPWGRAMAPGRSRVAGAPTGGNGIWRPDVTWMGGYGPPPTRRD